MQICVEVAGNYLKSQENQMTYCSYSRLTPKSFAASSQVTMAAALAGNALAIVGPKPV